MVYEVCFSLLPARKVLVISVSLLYHFRAEIQDKIAVIPNCHVGIFSFPFFGPVFTPYPVGAVLRRTRPNAICIPNRSGFVKKGAKSDNFLKLNDPNCHALDQFSVIGYIIPQAATNKFWTFQQGF